MRLKQKYRESAADVPALETGAPPVPDDAGATGDNATPVAPVSSDGAGSLLRDQLQAQRHASEAAVRVALDRVDDSIEAATEEAVEEAVEDALTERDDVPDLDPAEPTPEQRIRALNLPPLAEAWLVKHPQFVFDPRLNAKVQALHWDVLDEGHEAYGPEYFLELDRRLGTGGAVPMPASAEVERRPTPSMNTEPADQPARVVSAPVSRETPSWSGGKGTGRSSRVTLTPAMKEAARIAGVSEEDYARGLMRLAEEKERGNYGGSP
jgi:hypothetical protein